MMLIQVSLNIRSSTKPSLALLLHRNRRWSRCPNGHRMGPETIHSMLVLKQVGIPTCQVKTTRRCYVSMQCKIFVKIRNQFTFTPFPPWLEFPCGSVLSWIHLDLLYKDILCLQPILTNLCSFSIVHISTLLHEALLLKRKTQSKCNYFNNIMLVG